MVPFSHITTFKHIVGYFGFKFRPKKKYPKKRLERKNKMGCRFKCGYTNCNKKRYNLRTLKSHIKLDHGPQFIYTTIVQCLPCEYSGFFASLKESHPDKHSTCPVRNNVTSQTSQSRY